MKQIVLVNYGGPEKPSQIRNYLFRLFSDKNVIQLPGGAIYQRLFAQIISRTRTNKLKRNYEAINGSPLPAITRSLVNRLNQNGKNRYSSAMAYSPPYISEVLKSIPEENIFIFPLFPHFSRATTGACLSLAKKSKKKILYLREFWSDPDFNLLISKRIKETATEKGKTAIVFSAHSLPLKYAAKGDPYLENIHGHFELLKNLLSQYPLFLGFQSKLGPLKWAGPPLKEVLQNVQSSGFESIILYPLSFVIDNYETIFDLDNFYKFDIIIKQNLSFKRIACLNDSHGFVSFIEKQAEKGQWLELA